MANAAAPNGKPDHPGSVGRYEIVHKLGSGAMGAVYRARDTVLDREVAVKIMAGALLSDPGFRARFEREARIVARINHPNVVAAYDLGYHTDGSPFIAMELLSGQDLATILRTRRLDADDCAAVAMQVLAGLARAHQKEIVHRDVKPANIFLTNEGKVKVMDFGVARVTASAVTATGAVLGTAHYMSPEQLGGGRVDGRSDLFSVGCVLFEMLAARRPFQGEDMLGILYQIANAEPDFSFVSEEGQELMPILKRALEKDPARRYQSATDFARDLQHHLAGASSPWARHAAQVVELQPASGSGPVAEAGGAVDEDTPTMSGEPAPTSGPLTYLYDNAPTALHPDTTGRSSRPLARKGGLAGPATLAVIGVLGVALAGLVWWMGRPKPPPPGSPAAEAPQAATAAVPPPAAETGVAPTAAAPSATTSSEETPGSPPPASPVSGGQRGEGSAPEVSAPAVQAPPQRPAPQPARDEPRPPAAPDSQAEAPAAAPPSAAPAAAPAEEVEAHVTSPEVAGTATAADPVREAPAPAEREAPPPAPAAVAPAPVPDRAAAAPPAAAEASPPKPRSPLVVGATQGRHFDGRALPPTVKLGFAAAPDIPTPGQRSTVTVTLENGGSAMIQVRQVVVSTESGGDRRTETESSQALVAPGQKMPVLLRTVSWPASPPWSMEVVVHTRSGDTYTSTVTWR